MKMLNLPSELIEVIFSFLSTKFLLTTIRLVCKHFANCLYKFSILDLSELSITDKSLKQLLSRREWPQLHTLILQGCFSLHNPEIKCKTLQKLDITSNELENESIEYLLENCPMLKELRVDNLQKGIKIRHGRLEVLTLIYCDIKEVDMAFLINNCSELKCLELLYCENLKYPRIEHQKLTKLVIEHSPICDISVQFLSKRCPNLRMLSLRGCREIKDPIIESETLQELVLSESSIESIEKALKGCPNLKFLDISRCNCIPTEKLQISHKTLKSIDLSDLSITSDCLNCPKLSDIKNETKNWYNSFHRVHVINTDLC